MKKQLTVALVSSAPLLLLSPVAQAQETSRLSLGGSLEIGNDQVIHSDESSREIRDTYATGEVNARFALTNSIALFGGLTWESVVDPTESRTFEQMGLYVHELGVEFDLGPVAVQAGKVHPVWGVAWDVAAGFYGTTIAEDYELSEQIGVLADVDLGAAGALSYGVFYADDTVLSKSLGYNRGRNSSNDGGAGNTGKLNNVALQWSKEWDETYVHVGVRYLSAGTGDVKDEKGYLVGIGHSFAGGIDVLAEVAAFDGYGGTADDATYATLNAAYAIGNWTLSGTFASRDIDSEGRTNLTSVGAEYTFANGFVLGGALAYVDEAGTKDTALGVNLVIPFGD